MAISMLDLRKEYQSLKDEIDIAISQVLASGVFILGPNVSSFEKEFASYIGTKFAVAVASGTDALFLSLKAIGVKEGDEVITTPLTFFATSEAISYTGAKPVFVDVDPKTHNIDPKKILTVINKKTKAILPVHLWGRPAQMDQIMQIAKENNLFVVEDCAQSSGAEYNGKKTGSFGICGCFSFFPTKNLGCYGDGGIITTDDEKVYEKLKLLHLHGGKVRGIHEIIGHNSRLDEIQAAILRVKLKYLDRWNEIRRKNAAIYTKYLSQAGIKCPVELNKEKHVYHQYTIEVENRQDLIEYLKTKDISAFVYYPLPLHLQKPYKNLGYKAGDFPESEKIGNQMLSIPIHSFLLESDVENIAKTICEFYK